MNWIKATYSALALLAVMLTVGCSNDEPSVSGNDTVTFITSMEKAVTRSTTVDNMWNTTDEIAITDGTEVKKYHPSEAGAAVPLAAADTEASPFHWAIGKANMTFEAWKPYTTGNVSLQVKLKNDQRATATDAIADAGTLTDTEFSDYDLLYAPAKTAVSGTTVPLQFYHQMVHVVVYVIGVALDPDTRQESEEVIRVVLGGGNIATTGTLVKRGVTGPTATAANQPQWTLGYTNDFIIMRDADPQTATGDGGLKKRRIFECVLPPQSGGVDPVYEDNGEGGKTITVHGTVLLTFYTNKRSTYPYSYEAAFDYKAGYQYVYYIGLTKAGIYVDYQVEDWSSVTKTGAQSIFNYMDHPGAVITDWTQPTSSTTVDLGKDFK